VGGGREVPESCVLAHLAWLQRDVGAEQPRLEVEQHDTPAVFHDDDDTILFFAVDGGFRTLQLCHPRVLTVLQLDRTDLFARARHQNLTGSAGRHRVESLRRDLQIVALPFDLPGGRLSIARLYKKKNGTPPAKPSCSRSVACDEKLTIASVAF
jgi:hypothetical protein